jgi:hypothetical protein
MHDRVDPSGPVPPVPSAQSPDDTAQVRLGKREHIAAGMPAVWQTLRFGLREMGPIRGLGQLLRLNQKKGFDCQSCAWPSPDAHRKTAEFCENGVKAVSDEATTKRITREFFARHSVAGLAAQSDHWLNHQGRLTEPMLLREGATHYEPVSWPDAFVLIARELHGLASPQEAIFYTSGRTSNEAAFLYQLFARQFGTNNLPDCSNMCHESSGFALRESIGVGKERRQDRLDQSPARDREFPFQEPAGFSASDQGARHAFRPRHAPLRPVAAGAAQRRPGGVPRHGQAHAGGRGATAGHRA